MSTQAQAKGKKKNKESVKLSLEEFNQIDAPHGHSVVALKSLDWAETMADYDQQAAETREIIVPTAPRAQRGPGIDIESLPNAPPFKVSLFNAPLSMEEKDIRDRFFSGLDVLRVEMGKASSTVELGSRDHMYEALCKNEQSYKGKTISVCKYGEQPSQDRYGGRGGNYNDRNQGFGSRNDRYGDRPGGGYNRDREGYGGFSRGGGGGFGHNTRGFGDGYQDRDNFRDNNRGNYGSDRGEPVDEPSDWRAAARPVVKPPPPSAYNNGSRHGYMHSRPESSNYHQGPPHQSQYPESYQPRYQQHQSSNHMPNSQYNDRPGPNHRTLNPPPSEERPKLVIQPRSKPLNVDDVSSVKRNEAIFGLAKPSSKPYEKLNEIEEKLKTVQVSDSKGSPHGGSQSGSQPGSAPRSRQVSERS